MCIYIYKYVYVCIKWRAVLSSWISFWSNHFQKPRFGPWTAPSTRPSPRSAAASMDPWSSGTCAEMNRCEARPGGTWWMVIFAVVGGGWWWKPRENWGLNGKTIGKGWIPSGDLTTKWKMAHVWMIFPWQPPFIDIYSGFSMAILNNQMRYRAKGGLPSGRGKLTLSMAMFNSQLLNSQRVLAGYCIVVVQWLHSGCIVVV